MQFFFIKLKNIQELKTFRLHLIYSLIEGIVLGVLALNEFVLLKGLKGSEYQIGFLFQFTIIVLLLSVPLTELLKRIKNKKRMLRIVAFATRVPLLLLIFFPKVLPQEHIQFIYQYLFLGIFLIYFLANPVILPTINGFLKKNYEHKNFSKLYGYATTANKIIMLIATFVFGIILDNFPYAYTFVYPVIAILAIISIFILTKIDFVPQDDDFEKENFINSVKISFKSMLEIIKNNKAYRDFEIGFMFYGFAWLVTIAVITIFLDKVLHLNYTSIAFYKNSYNIISIIALPIFGKLLGKIDPRKFSIYTFLSMLIYLLFMALTQYFTGSIVLFGITFYWSLVLAYISYGFFAAMMGLLWYIGSAYFSKKNKDVVEYQSIHLSLTGFRGSFAPLIGILFYDLIGFTGVFALGILSLFSGIIFLIFSLKKRKI